MKNTDTLLQLRKLAVKGNGDPRPLVVAHSSWSKGYSVFLRENVDGHFNGHLYYEGTLCDAHWNAAEDAGGFYECSSSMSKVVIAQEMAIAFRRLAAMQKSNSAKADEPSCKDCIYQTSGECMCSTPCGAFNSIPVIAKEKKAAWPKYGMATTIMLREAKKALA